jgi:hypothetical protein
MKLENPIILYLPILWEPKVHQNWTWISALANIWATANGAANTANTALSMLLPNLMTERPSHDWQQERNGLGGLFIPQVGTLFECADKLEKETNTEGNGWDERVYLDKGMPEMWKQGFAQEWILDRIYAAEHEGDYLFGLRLSDFQRRAVYHMNPLRRNVKSNKTMAHGNCKT